MNLDKKTVLSTLITVMYILIAITYSCDAEEALAPSALIVLAVTVWLAVCWTIGGFWRQFWIEIEKRKSAKAEGE